MTQDPVKTRINITEGCSVGRLSVGQLVFNIRYHPLFEETPISYIRQGRLRECTCACGKVKLISEKSLESGRVLSCGCLKREKSIIAAQNRLKHVNNSEEKKRIVQEIRSEQARLAYYRIQNPRDEQKIDLILARIRELMLKRLKTVDFRRNAGDRVRRRENKLLTGVDSLLNRDRESQEQPE